PKGVARDHYLQPGGNAWTLRGHEFLQGVTGSSKPRPGASGVQWIGVPPTQNATRLRGFADSWKTVLHGLKGLVTCSVRFAHTRSA
ncbi:MAG: hypothetical protein WA970_03750, partial [Gammaproteobacteria bacterium]